MGVRAEPIYTQNSCQPPSCLWTCTHRTFPSHRRRGSGRTTCPPSRAPRTSGPLTRVASGTGTRPSSRPCPTSTPTSSTSSASSAEPELPPLTPVLPDAHDRIFTLGYTYMPVHTEIYGTYRARSALLKTPASSTPSTDEI